MYLSSQDFQKAFLRTNYKHPSLNSICHSHINLISLCPMVAQPNASYCQTTHNIYFVSWKSLFSPNWVLGNPSLALLRLIFPALTAFPGSPEVNTPLLRLRQVPPLASHFVLQISSLPFPSHLAPPQLPPTRGEDCGKLALQAVCVYVCNTLSPIIGLSPSSP